VDRVSQLGLFDPPAVVFIPPELATIEQRLAHPWWGRECPACLAPPGEPCRRVEKLTPYRTIHGQRS
jgi:hypothetical protein